MDPLGWFVAVAVVLIVLHVGVAAYLYRSATADTPTSADEYLPSRSADSRESVAEADGNLVVCGDCGARNDPAYRFCRQCVADLTSGNGGHGGFGSTERLGS